MLNRNNYKKSNDNVHIDNNFEAAVKILNFWMYKVKNSTCFHNITKEDQKRVLHIVSKHSKHMTEKQKAIINKMTTDLLQTFKLIK